MKLLYKIALSELASENLRQRSQSNLSQSGILQSDESVVEQLSSSPEDVSLSGRIQFGKPYSEIVAKELKELSNSSISDIPLYRTGREWDGAGYFELESADVNPAHTNAEEVWQYDLSISASGTRSSRLRAIETNRRKAEHEYGNDTSLEIGVPASARTTRWYDSDSQAVEKAEPVATRASEGGDVDIYDVDDSTFEDPDLVFDLPYAEEPLTDCAVYDTRGESAKYEQTENARIRQWQAVYLTSHDPRGQIVLDNGLIRLYLDEDTGTLEAETWDATAEAWASASLEQPSTIEVYDIDVVEVGVVRDKVQITFDVDGNLFALDAILQTGAESILFDIPEGETGPIPETLEDWLEPIASERHIDTNAAKTLVRRRRVRQ